MDTIWRGFLGIGVWSPVKPLFQGGKGKETSIRCNRINTVLCGILRIDTATAITLRDKGRSNRLLERSSRYLSRFHGILRMGAIPLGVWSWLQISTMTLGVKPKENVWALGCRAGSHLHRIAVKTGRWCLGHTVLQFYNIEMIIK